MRPGLLMLMLFAGCHEAPSVLSLSEFDDVVARAGGPGCTATCGGQLPGDGFAATPGWQLEGAAAASDAGLSFHGGGEAALAARTWTGAVALTARVAAGASGGALTIGAVRRGQSEPRGAWLTIDPQTGSVRGEAVSDGGVVSTLTLPWDPSEPLEATLHVTCGLLAVTTGAGTASVVMPWMLEADALAVRHAATGSAVVSWMSTATACAAGEGGSCEPACQGAGACSPDVCTVLGGCVATPVACDDHDPCTADICESTDGSCTYTPIPGCIQPLTGWSEALEVVLFEPSHDAAGVPDSLVKPAGEEGKSAVARQDELVEIPLRAGLPGDVVVYLPFDGDFDGVLPSGVKVEDFGSTFDAGAIGQALSPTGGPRLAVEPPHGGPLTLMIWVEGIADPPQKADIVGFYPPKNSGHSPTALRLLGGQLELTNDGETLGLGPMSPGWQHVAVTWDPVESRGRVYLDGRMTQVFSKAPSVDVAFLTLGPPAPPGQAPGQGVRLRVDDFVYALRALDPAEVAGYRRLQRPFGASLLSGQPDLDDIRVTLDGAIVPHEVVGRRPHSDSSPASAAVAASWRFDGGLDAEQPAVTSHAGTIAFESGAFGDTGGAIRLLDATTRLWTDRSATLSRPFSVELWVRLDGAASACVGPSDGAFLAQTARREGAGGEGGFILRACDGKPRFELRPSGGSPLAGATSIDDGRWHHVLVSVGTARAALYVDGILDAEAPAAADVTDKRNPITVMYGYGMDGTASALTAGLVDELIVHLGERSAADASDRVWPSVPAVRFLASTAGDDLPRYQIHAGNHAAPWLAPGDGCSALLAGCRGVSAWWRFDRGAGAGALTALDISGAGRHARWEAAPEPTPGLAGAAALLSGTGLTAADDPAWSLGTWTVEALVRPDALAGAQTIVHGSYVLRLQGASLEHVAGAAKASADTGDGWSLVGGTFDGKTLSAFSGANAHTAPAAAPLETPGALRIGVAPSGSDPFRGAIEAVRITNRALAPAERLTLPPLSWRIP